MSVRRWSAWAFVVVTAFASGVAVILRLVPWLHTVHRRLAEAASFIPFGLLGWALVLVGAGLLARRRVRSRERCAARGLAVLAAGGLLLQSLWVAPFFLADDPAPVPTKPVRVTTLNVMHGWAHVDRVMQEVGDTDVLVLVEMTPSIFRDLEEAGLAWRFPHRAGEPALNAAGTMVFSTWPMREIDLPERTWFDQVGVVIDVPDATELVVMGVHPVNPIPGSGPWVADADATRRNAFHLREAAPAAPMMVAGDFNATPDHVTMRRLTGELRLRYAADVAGAGWLWTWPVTYYRPFANIPAPAMLPIDHILVSPGVAARDVTSFSVPGSDHRGLHATLGLPAASG